MGLVRRWFILLMCLAMLLFGCRSKKWEKFQGLRIIFPKKTTKEIIDSEGGFIKVVKKRIREHNFFKHPHNGSSIKRVITYYDQDGFPRESVKTKGIFGGNVFFVRHYKKRTLTWTDGKRIRKKERLGRVALERGML